MTIPAEHLAHADRPSRLRSLLTGAACLTLVVGTASCGGDGDADAGGSDVDTLTITDARARTTPAQATTGVVYVDLTSPIDDTLVSATVDPAIAGAVELHETMSMDGDSDGHQHGGDSHDESHDESTAATADPATPMTMEPVEQIELPADETVSLEPGGLHAMLIDIAAPLTAGQTFTITLTFAEAGEQEVTVEVRDDV
jgi:copper(I)-binding protein